MTSKVDVVKAWTSLPDEDMEARAAYLSDDFSSVDHDGNVVMDKETYVSMGRILLASLPDFKWVVTDLREEDDFVIMTGHFQGTHMADLDLSAMGVGVIPASGKKIVWPEASVRVTVEGDKIAREEPADDSGGVGAFLAPLGVQMPSA